MDEDYFWDVEFPIFQFMFEVASRPEAKDWTEIQFVMKVMKESKGQLNPLIVRKYGLSLLNRIQNKRSTLV